MYTSRLPAFDTLPPSLPIRPEDAALTAVTDAVQPHGQGGGGLTAVHTERAGGGRPVVQAQEYGLALRSVAEGMRAFVEKRDPVWVTEAEGTR